VKRGPALVAVVLAVTVSAAAVLSRRCESPASACGPGFTRSGPRCCPTPGTHRDGVCVSDATASCPSPLVRTDRGCDAPERDVVEVPATRLVVGPSDWEAEGRVTSRIVDVKPFAIDRLEVTAGRACASRHFAGASFCKDGDPARAAFGVSLGAARAYCEERGGRLPTEDEWLAAAAGDRSRRYPWGDTGAVCRRAAWGLESGPCGRGAVGPDTVGAHPDGATPLGIHDLAGNVAEWVETASCTDPAGCLPIVRGGSWKSALATELRTWLRREVPLASAMAGGDPTIGFRCAYDRVR